MEQIKIQYFSCSPYHVGEEKFTSKTQELKSMVYKLLKDLQNEIHVNFTIISYQLRKQIESLLSRSIINGIMLKLPCSNTVFIHVMAKPDTGACPNIVCMHVADVCG